MASPTSVSASQPGDHVSQQTANDDEISKNEQDQIVTGPSTDLAIDLNVNRHKRRKLTSSTESHSLAQEKGTNWLHQLVDAAEGGPESTSEAASATDVEASASPKTKEPSPKPPASPRRTPRKSKEMTVPRKSSKSFTRNRAASPGITVSVASPTAKVTPKKKVLKLNRNGKLLSSPPLRSPQARSNGGRGDDKHENPAKSHRVVFKYGTNAEERSRIGVKINEMMNKPGIPQTTRLPRNDIPPKETHPFFLGKLAQKLDSRAGGWPDDGSSKDQMSEAEDQPSQAPKTVAWKDMVFKSQKPTFTKTPDVVSTSWPPNEIQHVGVELRNVPPSQSLLLRGAGASKSKEQRADIKSDEDIMHSKFSRACIT